MDYKGKKILIVDDEEDLCEILQYNLTNEGFHTEITYSAEDAIKKPLQDFDLILLDVMMGPISGFRFADKIRKELNLDVPIIFLTAKQTENDLLTGFSLGADDYILKPFSINELTARIRAVIKRTHADRKKSHPVIKYGELELDNSRKRLTISDRHIDLTKKEYGILRLLLENQGKVFSRDDILEKVWGSDIIVTERTIDVNMTRLRSKLGKYGSCLRNKSGYGYYFEF